MSLLLCLYSIDQNWSYMVSYKGGWELWLLSEQLLQGRLPDTREEVLAQPPESELEGESCTRLDSCLLVWLNSNKWLQRTALCWSTFIKKVIYEESKACKFITGAKRVNLSGIKHGWALSANPRIKRGEGLGGALYTFLSIDFKSPLQNILVQINFKSPSFTMWCLSRNLWKTPGSFYLSRPRDHWLVCSGSRMR